MILLSNITLKMNSFFDLIFFLRSNRHIFKNRCYLTILSSPFHYKVFKKNIFINSFYVNFNVGVYYRYYLKEFRPFQYSNISPILLNKKYFFYI